MLEVVWQLAQVLQELMRWAESCPCHWHLLQDFVSGDVEEAAAKKLRHLCDVCPFRGMRAAELASGDFFKVLQGVFSTSSAQLLQ
eukprot:12319603-Alexandrium_andersonii.AAC.1